MAKRLSRCCSGAVSVEAALVLPVLLASLLGILEFALLLFTYNSIQNAGRDVARQLSINFIAESDIPAEVTRRVPRWARDALAVDVCQSAPSDPEQNVISIAVSLPAHEAAPLAFFTRMSGADWTLGTVINMKQELPQRVRHDFRAAPRRAPVACG
ncbi:hypothetical protein BH23PSE1_BH23PSE1_06380 [soil metagenome]